MNNTIIQVILGPTASGKSAYALDKAKQGNGVIINCDAMQSYDALPVLTAQPSAEEQAAAPHKLYGHLHPRAHYSAAEWRDDAIQQIETAWENNQTPILCGGTGFYLKALMDGLSPMPDTPPDIRIAAIEYHETIGTDALFKELQSIDPQTAANLDPKNGQRIVRAWEVYQHTQKPLIEWQNEPLQGAPDGWNFHVAAIFPNRDSLINKIHARLDVMMDLGVLDEVRALNTLIKNGEVGSDALITKAIGFNHFRDYLNNEKSLIDAIEKTKIETRQYSKRQMTWLRNQITIDENIETL